MSLSYFKSFVVRRTNIPNKFSLKQYQRFSTNILVDYDHFCNYLKKFCCHHKMEIDYSVLSKNEELIVPMVWELLRKEAEVISNKEPLMKPMINEAILQQTSFKDALIYRLATKMGGDIVSSEQWIKIFHDAHDIPQDDFQYDLVNAACLDLVAVKDRDPACDTLFTAFMFFKGYKALQIYRVSHVLWREGRKELASLLQSRTSEVFSVDIHPAARIGRGLMIDHASGLVVGETAVVGEHCSFLHGVTLGSTGKEAGDRHPKLGDNVSVGCNASIIGNIRIGNNAKIGSGSVVVKPVPDNCTAIGIPAKIVPPKDTSSTSSSTVTHTTSQHKDVPHSKHYFSGTPNQPIQRLKDLFPNALHRSSLLLDSKCSPEALIYVMMPLMLLISVVSSGSHP